MAKKKYKKKESRYITPEMMLHSLYVAFLKTVVEEKKGRLTPSPFYINQLISLPLDKHGHDYVDVVVGADGADNAGAGGVGCFEDYP